MGGGNYAGQFNEEDYFVNFPLASYFILEVKINFEFKKGVGIAIKSKETSS